MQKRLTLTITLAVALCACQSAPAPCFGYGPWPACPSECPEAVGAVSTVTMLEADVIVVQYAPNCVHEMPPLTIRRSEHPEAFDGYVEVAGGLVPGETKPLRAFEGYLQMNDDRSLTITPPVGPHNPPHEEMIRPGEARYDELLTRVGGLVPGERKMVTREAQQ